MVGRWGPGEADVDESYPRPRRECGHTWFCERAWRGGSECHALRVDGLTSAIWGRAGGLNGGRVGKKTSVAWGGREDRGTDDGSVACTGHRNALDFACLDGASAARGQAWPGAGQ